MHGEKGRSLKHQHNFFISVFCTHENFTCSKFKMRRTNALLFSSAGQDQQLELVSVLRLLTHTCKKLPGVFGHGKGNAILPVIGRLIPLFASPILRYDYDCSKDKAIAF